MKRNNLLPEVLSWLAIIIPNVYLFFAWDQLPDEIPVHFNLAGEPDRWASKSVLVALIPGMTLLLYLLLKILPAIDPKKRLDGMGAKLSRIRFVVVLFMSAFAIFIIRNATASEEVNTNIIFVIAGLFFIVSGNYFQSIKPNYFLGIRTPWTLEDEDVWKKTHRLGGRLWMLGGALIVLLAIIDNSTYRFILFITIMLVTIIIPTVYSYVLAKSYKY